MKKSLILAALVAAPFGIAFAGGAGNASMYDMMNNATSASTSSTSSSSSASTTASSTTTTYTGGSTENPLNIVQSREVSGSSSDAYLRYSYDYIPNSFWAEYTGLDLTDVNGSIELEEYLGEIRRDTLAAGEYAEREEERQDRAQSKASRLRFLYR